MEANALGSFASGQPRDADADASSSSDCAGSRTSTHANANAVHHTNGHNASDDPASHRAQAQAVDRGPPTVPSHASDHEQEQRQIQDQRLRHDRELAEASTGAPGGASSAHSTSTPTARAASPATTVPASSHEADQHRNPEQHHGHQHPAPIPHFVAPSSYLWHKTAHRSAMATPPQPARPSPLDKEQRQGLKAIREFLRVRTSYDVLPLSFRLIVLDTNLLIKKSLNILIQNSIVSAPLWNSTTSRFAGLLDATDYINVVQYYCQFPDEMHKLDQFRLSSLRDIEKAIGAVPIQTVSVHPSQPLYEACRRMLKTRARRIPLVDVDDESGKETVVSVITQYRILKFIAVNNEHNTLLLKKTVRELQLGTYRNLVTAHMNSTVLDVVHLMVDHNISCVPIVDGHNRVLNAFEAVDVIACLKGGAYEELDGTVGEALCKRSEDSPGIYTCNVADRLDSIFDTIRKSRVHRLVVMDDDNRLKGVISLSDLLKYVLLEGEGDEAQWL